MGAVVQAFAWLLLIWLFGNLFVFIAYRRTLAARWREPVLRHPVLIVESDDWGAGPVEQADALRAIARVLARHRDASGRTPVVGLALVLAGPDGPAIRASGTYRRSTLGDACFEPIAAALRDGRAQGLFAFQLHGLEHYWPEALMSCDDPVVRSWLTQDEPAATEQLPAHLQSRWVDASRLPSVALTAEAVRQAAAMEVDLYARLLGELPRIVVPPTFVWTRDTERAWAMQGIECVVTPGWRYVQRDAAGLPAGDEGPIANGDQADGVGYLTRTDYFEPARGRDAMYALAALDRATAEGRPCLLENHRDNFIRDPATCQRSLEQLDRLYLQALQRHQGLRFLSSLELARILRSRDAAWLATGWRKRLPAVVRRLRSSGRPWKLMRLSGLAAVLDMVASLAGRPASEHTRSTAI